MKIKTSSKATVTSTIPLVSNVARDAIKRASDFRTHIDAFYESVANAYEAYDIGSTPRIDVSIDARKRVVAITDYGVGMCKEIGLRRFFALHMKTTRREGGLNHRGFNGTGKIAFLKFGAVLLVRTVKDGLCNVARLTRLEMEAAAAEERDPLVEFLLENEPVDEPNGTTITIEGVRKDFDLSGKGLRDIKDKIALEQMMWMKAAVISVNGDAVAPASIPNLAREPRRVVSPCGNFEIAIYNSKIEMPSELRYVFISAGSVFVARESFGMEGSKYAPFVHADLRASDEWTAEHFYEHRENFVSEARDLKLKLTHPEALKLREFAEREVAAFIAELQAEEDERRRASLDEHRQTLERELSRFASSLHVALGAIEEGGIEGSHPRTGERRTRVEKRGGNGKSDSSDASGNARSPIGVTFDSFDPSVQYRIQGSNQIVINKDFPTVKAVGTHTSKPIYKAASMPALENGLAELVCRARMEAEFGEAGDVSLAEFLDVRSKIAAEIANKVATVSSIAFQECAEYMR